MCLLNESRKLLNWRLPKHSLSTTSHIFVIWMKFLKLYYYGLFSSSEWKPVWVLIHCALVFAGFFVATQFFFTLCFTLLLIASFLVALYLCCSREHERFVLLLFVIGTDLTIAGNDHQLIYCLLGYLEHYIISAIGRELQVWWTRK
jgi:hypothetical protein